MEIEHPQETEAKSISIQKKLRRVQEQIDAIINSPRVEPEEATLMVLDGIADITRHAIALRTGKPLRAKLDLRRSSAGAILSLNSEPAPVEESSTTLPESDAIPSPSFLSTLAVDLLKLDKVFISPRVLSTFVHLQTMLGRSRSIPEIFHLYANKPVPVLDSSPPKYSKTSPKGHKQAIPGPIAERALTAALDAKDMSLALRIIDTTYCAPAWRSHKFISKVLPPGLVATITPLALYVIASELSLYSNFMDPWEYKIYAFAGLMTYALCTGTLGFVAMTTHNDHFERVVWRPGVPLYDRWVREDERAALDRIACAWGFKEEWRRGDEEGEDWEGLRQWCGLRGMILDKTDLMPGMNA